MKYVPLIATKPKSGGGSGTDEDPGFPNLELRSHGIVVLVFGFAFGLAAFLSYYILSFTGTAMHDYNKLFDSQIGSALVTLADQLFTGSLTTALLFFVSGLVFGTILAGLYNVLIFRRLNLFGIDRTLD